MTDADEECTHTGMLKSGCYHCLADSASIKRAPRELIPDKPLCLTEGYGYVHEEHCEPKPDTWPEHLSLR